MEGVNIRVFFKDGRTETRPYTRIAFLPEMNELNNGDKYSRQVDNVNASRLDYFFVNLDEVKAVQVFWGDFVEKNDKKI